MKIILFLVFLAQSATIPPVVTPVERLRAKTPVEAVNNLDPVHLAGRYKSESEELRNLVGGFLSGDDVYLFPDGTYIYCEWADIMPVTVIDKGTWAIAEDLVVLTSDKEITWKLRNDRKYAIVRRSSRNSEILLFGIGELSYFEDKAGNDAEFMLLMLAKVRVKPIKKSGAAKLKAKIMKESWRP